MWKLFKKKDLELKELIAPMGYCFATDEITKNGKKIGYMYRDISNRLDNGDSGWRFFSGEETDEYVNNPNNIKLFEVNTIANFDPDIIPFLTSDFGVAFGRNIKTGKFAKEEFHPSKDE